MESIFPVFFSNYNFKEFVFSNYNFKEFVFSSGKISHGLKFFATSKSIRA